MPKQKQMRSNRVVCSIGWGQQGNSNLASPVGCLLDEVAAGLTSINYIKRDGSIVCRDAFDNVAEAGRVSAPGGKGYTSLTASVSNSWCAAIKDGSIVIYGILVTGFDTPPAGTNFVKVVIGNDFGLGLTDEGAIVHWGNTTYGQDVIPAGVFRDIAATSYSCAAITTAGELKAWGWNAYGQCDVPAGNEYIKVAGGDRHCLAMKEDRTIVGWGCNCAAEATIPVDDVDTKFAEITAGHHNSLCLRAEGSLLAFGDNANNFVTDCPEGPNFKKCACGYRTGVGLYAIPEIKAVGTVALSSIVSGVNYYPDKQKRRVTKIAQCRLDYAGNISIKFDGITMSPVWPYTGEAHDWPDPNRTFIIPRKDTWSEAEANKWIWETNPESEVDPEYPDDNWAVYFTFDDHYYTASQLNENCVYVCGQLALYRSSWASDWGVAFETHSRLCLPAYFSDRQTKGNPTVDVCCGKRLYLPGGRFPDLITVKVRNSIVAADIDYIGTPYPTYDFYGGAIGYGGHAHILTDGCDLFTDNV
jgi:hypothetical protein